MSFLLRLLTGSTEKSSQPESMSGEEFTRSIKLINATQFVIPCPRFKKETKKVSEETSMIHKTVNSEENTLATEEKPLKRLF